MVVLFHFIFYWIAPVLEQLSPYGVVTAAFDLTERNLGFLHLGCRSSGVVLFIQLCLIYTRRIISYPRGLHCHLHDPSRTIGSPKLFTYEITLAEVRHVLYGSNMLQASLYSDDGLEVRIRPIYSIRLHGA